MSFHANPKYNPPEMRALLVKHGLEAEKPSQLSDAFRLGYQAALPKWVKIEDIPDNWKDGKTEVDLHVTYYDESGSHRLTDCRFNSTYDEWETSDYFLSDFCVYPTHAMLPPSPPKDNES